ncbi:hypothetical protein Tco_0452030 [Tanacetum coccineum]
MGISVIKISSNSSEESVRTSTARVILSGAIPTAISATVPIVDPPVVHDDTPLIPKETPTILPLVSTLPHTSLFLYTDSSDSDTSERPPSQDPYEVTIARWRSRPILVGPLPSHRLALRYSESHSPAGHFSPDDFSSDISSGSSSGYSSNTSSGYSILDSSFDSPAASLAGPSHKRRRSPVASVALATPIPGALSLVRADLLPPRKRIRGFVSTTDYEVSSKESYEPYTEPDIDSDVQADIDACIAAADAAAAKETDARVEVDTRIDREDEDDEEFESSHRGTVEIGVDTIVEPVVSEDTPVPTDDEDTREDFLNLISADGSREIPINRITGIEAGQRELETNSLISDRERAAMSERIGTLERDNMRLRALLCIERERIDSLRCHMAYTQEDLRQIRRFRYYDRMKFRRLETYGRRRLGYRP